METRPPTRFDIGKQVEVSIQNDWFDAELVSFTEHEGYTEYEFRWAPDDKDTDTCFECRVPYTTTDTIAELSAAADWMAERGQDEAARVLMANIEARELIDRIVIAEGIDAGVIMLSHESPTHYEQRNGRQVSVYNHENFSELGDALVALSRLIKGTQDDNSTQIANG